MRRLTLPCAMLALASCASAPRAAGPPAADQVSITQTNTTRYDDSDITWDDAVFFWWDDTAPVVLTQ